MKGFAGLLFLVSCSGRVALDQQALEDPAVCQTCHADHYREWSGSMHAQASDDPVFLALNRLGQADTAGALGDFCVRCHAPLAVARGDTFDGLNLETLPRSRRGVGCYFCHQVTRVLADHNGALELADDRVFRGGQREPLATEAHLSQYSSLHDGEVPGSSALCGACHDVVNPAGVHLERTYAEWQDSVFSRGEAAVSCGACHQPGREARAATVPGAPVRRVHDHAVPAVDVALGPWPEQTAQRAGIERDLRGAVKTKLCVRSGGLEIQVTLENALVGHAWPSGVTHARRAWVELLLERDGALLGRIGGESPEVSAEGASPGSWVLRGRMFDAAGVEVHTTWLAARTASNLLLPTSTLDPTDPRFYHAQTRVFRVATDAPDRITLNVYLRPLGTDVLDDLVGRGALDPAVAARVPVFRLAGATKVWRRDSHAECGVAPEL